jgi:hypothetical protein
VSNLTFAKVGAPDNEVAALGERLAKVGFLAGVAAFFDCLKLRLMLLEAGRLVTV